MEKFSFELAQIKSRLSSGNHLRQFDQLIQKLSSQPIILYGYGEVGKDIAKFLISRNVQVECFADTYKHGTAGLFGLPIISPDELARSYKTANIIITSDTYFNEICEQLIALGLSEYQMSVNFSAFNTMIADINEHEDGYAWAYEHFDDELSKSIVLARLEQLASPLTLPFFNNIRSCSPQYFENGIINLGVNEVFVDAGMFTGDTAQILMNLTKDKHLKYYGFEPDSKNFAKATDKLLNINNVELSQMALWDSVMQLNFAQGLEGSSKVMEDSLEFVQATSLDVYFKDKQPPTFIKMDIEGAEKQALIGAKDIISKNCAKLAICVYHKPEDIYELPQIMKLYSNKYRFFLRHYTNHNGETVMYALVDGGN